MAKKSLFKGKKKKCKRKNVNESIKLFQKKFFCSVYGLCLQERKNIMKRKNNTTNIQISEELFLNLCKYHLFGLTNMQDEIVKGLKDKMDRINKRTIYTESKMNPDENDRETARKQYVELSGIPEGFRY